MYEDTLYIQRMGREEMKKTLKKLAEEMFEGTIEGEFEEINLAEHYAMTSIDVLEYILSIETEFDFEFEDDDLVPETLESGKKLLDIIEGRMN